MEGKTKIIVAVIIILIAGGVSAFIWLRVINNQAPLEDSAVIPPVVEKKPNIIAPIVTSTPTVVEKVLQPEEMANWKIFKNEKYGLEFKYPAVLDFAGSQVAMARKIVYTVSAYEADVSYYIAVYDKKAGEADFDLLIAAAKNEHVKKQLTLLSGVMIMDEGVNAVSKYYLNGYVKGVGYNYLFELTAPAYTQELLSRFEQMASTFQLTK